MKFVWGNVNRDEKNLTLAFCLKGDFSSDTKIRLYASNVYRIFVDGNFVCYGPERTAEDYSRERIVKIANAKTVVIEVAQYRVWSYNNSLEQPFFSAEVISNGKTVADSYGFSCHLITDRVNKVQRISYQRNFIEYYDMSFDKRIFYNGDFSVYPEVGLIDVESPVLLSGNPDFSSYTHIPLRLVNKGTALRKKAPVDDYNVWWGNYVESGEMEGYKASETEADPVGEISCIDFEEKGDLEYYTYSSEVAVTGLISLNVKANKDSVIYALFDEIDQPTTDGKPDVKFIRPTFYNIAVWKLKKGEYGLLSFEPYELKYVKFVIDGSVKISNLEIIEIANKNTESVKFTCENKKIEKVFEAGRNTFCQNAVDIFMDCPSRERAGWLCDSYFTARTEQLLVGNSLIEHNFLENFLLCKGRHLPKGMIPMCYPAENGNGTFIPNWSMWYVLELGEYYERTADKELVLKAKPKIYELIEYFDKFVNKDGLLENLEGWIFLEWSVANSSEYVCGVNYPSNMLFSKMLKTVSFLYNDKSLYIRSEKITDKIFEQSYNGEFFVDNAVRDKDGKLTLTKNISETCQYYALNCGIKTDKKFVEKMLSEFGPNRPSIVYPFVGKSNVFIGNYLRLKWLLSIGEYERVDKESIDYFYYMAEKTGTLWEYQGVEASCNHGFTSVICCYIVEFVFGFCGFSVKDKSLIFKNDVKLNVNAKITLPVGKGNLVIEVKDGKRSIENNTEYGITEIGI